jgi:hypothetical protein
VQLERLQLEIITERASPRDDLIQLKPASLEEPKAI